MSSDSPALAATLRAMYGEADMHAVSSAFGDLCFAQVLALAPAIAPLIGALGALAGELPGLLSPGERTSPVLSAAIASLIRTNTVQRILPTWATVAPAGWGAAHTAALIDAVQHDRCSCWAAAALIGPCDASAPLLRTAREIARAIRRWGQTTPDDPTAWMDDLRSTEQKRLLSALKSEPYFAAVCLPWLPRPLAASMSAPISDVRATGDALDAYAGASPVARERHAATLSTLIRCANQYDLAALTRLAAASHMDTAWNAVAHLLCTDSRCADHVLAATPWDDLRENVRETILLAANNSDMCAAIAFARGVRSDPSPITEETARAFFAAVIPAVWDALTEEERRTWLSHLAGPHAYLAVRSLGLDPIFLARAHLNNDLVSTVRRHLHDDAAVQRTLLPIAVRDAPIVAVPAIVAALPPPSDPIPFTQIAGHMPEMPPALRDWITEHPTAQAAATVATVLRAAMRSGGDDAAARCAALAEAFAGWTTEKAATFLATLPDSARVALHPNADALANALAHPNQRNAFRQALDALTALPPSAALSSFHALDALAEAFTSFDQQNASEGLAQALRNHGNCFLALVDALSDAHQMEALPARNDETHASLRAIAAADPLVAHRLAHALRDGDAAVALDALAAASFDTLTRIWNFLPETIQHVIPGDRDALLRAVAAPERANDVAQALRNGNVDDAPSWLALRLLIDADEGRRARGVMLLARRPDLTATLLPLLRNNVRAALESVPAIAVAGADLPPPHPAPAPAQRRRRR